MTARLFCRTGRLAGQVFVIDREASIGSGVTNTVVLALPTISREHARITLDDRGRYLLQDLNSRNGTRVDDRPVRGTTPLGDLHVITFAEQHDFIFQVPGVAARGGGTRPPAADLGATPERPPAPAVAANPPAAAASNTIFRAPGPLVMPGGLETRRGDPPPARATVMHRASSLIPPRPIEDSTEPERPAKSDTVRHTPPGFVVPDVVTGPLSEPARGRPGGLPPEVAAGLAAPAKPPAGRPGVGQAHWHLEFQDPAGGGQVVHRLIEGDQRMGRSAECEVRIENRTLSRVHALLSVRDGRLTISDLGSANGTVVNGVRISGPVAAREGTVIAVGEIRATLAFRP